MNARLVAGGKSNLTYVVGDGRREVIVRRPPLGHVLATAHDMVREHRVIVQSSPSSSGCVMRSSSCVPMVRSSRPWRPCPTNGVVTVGEPARLTRCESPRGGPPRWSARCRERRRFRR
ncbi:phosphotransferase [Intrasporangium oryzae]|uniref:phosphotransferase n=1 Tax=Intrasporangium oryzae TaxID=412687 RepID=UPI0038990900